MSIYSVRQSVFETNSSSSHSLFIPADKSEYDYDEGFLNGENIKIDVRKNYGWENFKLTSWREKARYVFTDYSGHQPAEDRAIRAIEEFAGCTIDSVSVSGSIDHNSVGTIPNSLDVDELENLIFGSGVIYGGNDNSPPPESFYSEANAQLQEYDYPATALLDENDNICDMIKVPTETSHLDSSTPYFSRGGNTPDASDALESVVRHQLDDPEELTVYGFNFRDETFSISYTCESGYDSLKFGYKFIDPEKIES